MSCLYCSSDETEKLYQESNYVVTNFCPPYSDCVMRNKFSKSVFIINYCPECGRDLKEVWRRDEGRAGSD